MTTSKEGLEFIKDNEGLRLIPYQDEGGVWTVGYGHTGTDVIPGLKYTMDQVNELFLKDITEFEDELNGMLKVAVTQNQFDSLMDFVYNEGPAALHRSTLLKRVNVGDFQGAAKEFLKWDIVAGRPDPGLLKRRRADKTLFLKE